jgi:hypothetical protein
MRILQFGKKSLNLSFAKPLPSNFDKIIAKGKHYMNIARFTYPINLLS